MEKRDDTTLKLLKGWSGLGLAALTLGLLVAGQFGFPPLMLADHGKAIAKGIGLPQPFLTETPLDAGTRPWGLFNETLIKVARRTQPVVVNIAVTTKAEIPQLPFPFFDDPFFRRFFGEEFGRRFRTPDAPRRQGTGSGVIVTTDGYIITNHHVVESAEDIQVLLADRRKFTANVVGTDQKTDLALIKIDAHGLPVLPWGDSSQLQVGEMVMAVGNPFGLNQTVTLGIVSAIGRANVGIVDYEDLIQTDAAINPGNSGGALVNLRGELVGINTAIFTRSGGYMGIGFAIPSNMVRSVEESLLTHGKVIRGWLGVSIQDLTPDLRDQFHAPDTKGALVTDVLDNGPADKAGFKRGDIIREYDRKNVEDSSRLRSLVADTPPNSEVTAKVLRDGRSHILNVTIGEMSREITRKSVGEAEGMHALSGIAVEPLPKGKGVEVARVQPGSAAERAGVQVGDIILEINRHPVGNLDDFKRLTQKLRPEEKVLVLLKRGRAIIFLSINPRG